MLRNIHHDGSMRTEIVSTEAPLVIDERPRTLPSKSSPRETPDSAAIGGLSSAIAHEIRQALTGIVLTGQALKLRLNHAGASQPEFDAMLDHIVETSQHAAAVVHRLQALTHRETVPGQRVDLNKLVADALRLARNETSRCAIVPVLELAENLPAIHADPVQIIQIISNLVRNACEAMAATAESERRLILSTRLDDTGRVSLAVIDTGAGIAPDVHRKLFHPFKTRKPAGMGIGLTICRLIAETHRAKITASNNPAGPGARFVLALPAAGTALIVAPAC
ncbi:MAG: sensory box protein [Verrucomicrobia bacterium]|nr:sensory box protein [Verrucomicrobiota bacterium]